MRISKTQKLGLIAIAVLLGLTAGSYRQLIGLLQPESADEPATATKSGPQPPAPGAAGQLKDSEGRNGTIRPVPAGRVEPEDTNSVVMVADGLSLVRAEEDGAFLGYRVLANNEDPRFSEGDIITSLNGEPVEDSAAGTELLTIALMDPTTKIAVTTR